jgi:hypothetical protein
VTLVVRSIGETGYPESGEWYLRRWLTTVSSRPRMSTMVSSSSERRTCRVGPCPEDLDSGEEEEVVLNFRGLEGRMMGERCNSNEEDLIDLQL